MDNVNKTTVQTTGASLIGLLAGYAAGHGWLGLSAGDWTTIVTAGMSIWALVWPILATRAQSLKDTVGHMEKTTVVTSMESANALPKNPDVIGATQGIIAEVKKAQREQGYIQ